MNIKIKVVVALALAAFVLPGISMAQTMSVAQLQAEIQSLTAQLTQLEAQLTAAGGTTTAWCYTFNTNLSIGMSGAAVTALQTALQKDGESVTVNGTFDDQTAAAITSFQEKYSSAILAPYGLNNGTGYAGKSTRAELNSLFGCTGSNPGTPPIVIMPPIVVNPIVPTSSSPRTACPMFAPHCPYGGNSVVEGNGCTQEVCNQAPTIYPAGCTSFSGYSSVNGQSCGCTLPSGYSSTNGESCAPATAAPLSFSVSTNSVASGGAVIFTWSGLAAPSGFVNFFVTNGCPSGITMYDLTNSQTFRCGDVARSVAASGSDTISFTNTNSTPTQITFGVGNGAGPSSSQTITVQPAASSVVGGVLTGSLSQSTPAPSYLGMGITGVTLAQYQFESNANSGENLTQVNITDSSSANAVSASMDHSTFINYRLTDTSGNMLATASENANGTLQFNLSGLNVPVNATEAVILKADVNSYSYATSGATHAFALTSFNYTNAGASNTQTVTSNNIGNLFTVYQTTLGVTGASFANPTSIATVGNTVGEFTFTAGSGNINPTVKTVTLSTSGSLIAGGTTQTLGLYDASAPSVLLASSTLLGTNSATFNMSAMNTYQWMIPYLSSKTLLVKTLATPGSLVSQTNNGGSYQVLLKGVTWSDGTTAGANITSLSPSISIPVASQNITGLSTTAATTAIVPTVTFSANPTTITANPSSGVQPTTLTWSSTNATTCAIWGTNGYNDNGAWGEDGLAPSGSLPVGPYALSTTSYTALYRIYCTGPGGTSQTASATVIVNPAPVSTPLLSIVSVNGLQSSYKTNQPISFTLNGVQLPSNKPADSQEGFNVQAGGLPGVNGVNGSYNSVTGLWNVTIPAPSTAGTYTLTTYLYCGNTNASCHAQYTNAASQVTKTFTVNVVAAPAVTLLSPNGDQTYQIGSVLPISWNIVGMTTANNSIGVMVFDAATQTKVYLSQAVGDAVSTSGVVSPTGTYNWTIPSTVPPGNYLAEVSWGNSYAQSKTSFVITAAATVSSSTQTAIMSQSLQGLLDQLNALLKSL